MLDVGTDEVEREGDLETSRRMASRLSQVRLEPGSIAAELDPLKPKPGLNGPPHRAIPVWIFVMWLTARPPEGSLEFE